MNVIKNRSNRSKVRLYKLSVCTLFLLSGAISIFIWFELSNPYSLAYGTSLIFAVAFYAAFSRIEPMYYAFPLRSGNNYKIAVLCYFLCASAVMMIYYSSSFERTLEVHLLVGILYLVGIAVAFMDHATVAAILTILTAIFQRGLAYFSSPIILGSDSNSHALIVERITQSGDLSSLLASKYYYSPLYHVLTAIGGAVTDLSVYHSVFFVASIISVLIIGIFTYALANLYFASSWSTVAATVVLGSDFVINWGIQPQATTIGLCLFLIGLFGFICYLEKHQLKYFLLFFFSLIALSFSHDFSVFLFIFAIVLISISLLKFRVYRAAPILTVVLVTFLNYSVSYFGGPARGETPFFDFLIFRLISFLSQLSAPSQSSVILPNDPTMYFGASANLQLIHVLGSAFFLLFSLIAVLHIDPPFVDKKRDYDVIWVLALTGGVMLVIVLAGPIAGARDLLPWRWYAYIYLILALPATLGLKIVTGRITNVSSKTVATIVLLTLVFCALFTMSGNFRGAYDDPLFDESPTAERYGYSESEAAGIEFTSSKIPHEERVISDERVAVTLDRGYEMNSETILLNYPELRVQNDYDVLIHRSYFDEQQARYDLLISGEVVTTRGTITYQTSADNQIYTNGDMRVRNKR